jgi:hypothetical protein
MNHEPEWLTELLLQSERQEADRREQMSRLRADQMLQAIRSLELEAERINTLADDEQKLIDDYRQQQIGKIEKKISWFELNLLAYMNSNPGVKTLELPHGVLKTRLGRDRAEIVEEKTFLDAAGELGLLRRVPEKSVPDMAAIMDFIHTKRTVPPGVKLIPAENRFSYSTNKGDESNVIEQRQSSQAGTERAERVSSCEVAQG